MSSNLEHCVGFDTLMMSFVSVTSCSGYFSLLHRMLELEGGWDLTLLYLELEGISDVTKFNSFSLQMRKVRSSEIKGLPQGHKGSVNHLMQPPYFS